MSHLMKLGLFLILISSSYSQSFDDLKTDKFESLSQEIVIDGNLSEECWNLRQESTRTRKDNREDCDIVRLNPKSLQRKQPAIVVDTKKPYNEIEMGSFVAGSHTWQLPYRSDWAIAVGLFSGK